MIANLSSSKELNMMTAKITAVALGLSLALSSASAFAQAPMANGEVKKIDEAAGKITLKHGPIKSLDMEDEMTMVFRVQDPAMLKQVKVGDKVKFDAERAPAGITVTKIQKSK
jgi:Cu(I)/Ag(I) efflux system protein CusF